MTMILSPNKLPTASRCSLRTSPTPLSGSLLTTRSISSTTCGTIERCTVPTTGPCCREMLPHPLCQLLLGWLVMIHYRGVHVPHIWKLSLATLWHLYRQNAHFRASQILPDQGSLPQSLRHHVQIRSDRQTQPDEVVCCPNIIFVCERDSLGRRRRDYSQTYGDPGNYTKGACV
mgnify:CR=1 FL=1